MALLQLCVLGCVLMAGVSAQVSQPDCMVDLIFVMDRSGSINQDAPNGNPVNIQKIHGFLNTLVNSFNIGPNFVQVGLVSFANEATTEFQLGEYKTRGSVNTNINATAIKFTGGRTATQHALEMARELFNGPAERDNVDNVVVILTDGQPTESLNPNLMGAADDLKNNYNARIIGIGVTPNVGQSLVDTVSSPSSDNFFSIDRFEDLAPAALEIGQAICRTPPPVLPECPAPIDGVAFSAYANFGSTQYAENDRVHFNSTYLNRGGSYRPDQSEFICPCRGVYTFTHMMSGLYFSLATVIKIDGRPVSPLAYVLSDGQLSTETVIACDEGQRVYVDVVMSASAGFVPCSYKSISLAGFTGRLDFTY